MNTDLELDDALLDRLVDGELTAEERRQALAALDAQPHAWRRCALAFLEAQSWHAALPVVVAETVGGPRQEAAAVARAPVNEFSNRQRVAGKSWRRRVGVMATAAAVLAAFLAGRFVDVDLATWRGSTGAGPGAQQVAGAAPPRAGAAADALHLLVRDANGQLQRVPISLVDGRQLGAAFAEAPPWAGREEFQRELSARGLNLAARRRYAPLLFEQQDRVVPMIVPIDDAVVTPIGRPL